MAATCVFPKVRLPPSSSTLRSPPAKASSAGWSLRRLFDPQGLEPIIIIDIVARRSRCGRPGGGRTSRATAARRHRSCHEREPPGGPRAANPPRRGAGRTEPALSTLCLHRTNEEITDHATHRTTLAGAEHHPGRRPVLGRLRAAQTPIAVRNEQTTGRRRQRRASRAPDGSLGRDRRGCSRSCRRDCCPRGCSQRRYGQGGRRHAGRQRPDDRRAHET